MKLAKLNGNGNGDGNHKESKNESLVHEQDIKVIQMPSTDEKKHQQPDTDATSSKFPRGSHAKQWRKKVTHAQTANPTRDALQAVIAMEAPTLSNTLPNISSHRHSDGHATEGKILDSYLLQPKVEDCILRTIATLSIYDRQGRTKWAKIRGHRRNPSAWNDQSGQLVEGCYTKYVYEFSLCFPVSNALLGRLLVVYKYPRIYHQRVKSLGVFPALPSCLLK